MWRALKLGIVLMLVICSGLFLQTDKTSFIMNTAKADGTNITWEMLNQTIDELRIWLSDQLDNIETNLSAEQDNILLRIDMIISEQQNLSDQLVNKSTIILDRINQSVTQINETVSFLLFGSHNLTLYNYSLIGYLEERLDFSNLTVSVSNVTFEGINESTVLGKLYSIESALGYGNSNATVYDDLEYILTGLVDANGQYILRNSDGLSSFYIMGDYLVTTLENQQTISDNMYNMTNTTNNLIQDEASSIKKNQQAQAQWTVENSSSIWSIIAALGVLILLFYLFVYTRYFASSPTTQSHTSERRQTDERTQNPPSKPIGSRIVSKLTNPLKMTTVGKHDEIPSCFKDGITYDPAINQYCGACYYADDCAREKIAAASTHNEQRNNDMQNYQQSDRAPADFSPPGISPGEVDNILQTEEIDIDKW